MASGIGHDGVPLLLKLTLSVGTFHREDVRAVLAKADWVSLKVDAADEVTWRQINCQRCQRERKVPGPDPPERGGHVNLPPSFIPTVIPSIEARQRKGSNASWFHGAQLPGTSSTAETPISLTGSPGIANPIGGSGGVFSAERFAYTALPVVRATAGGRLTCGIVSVRGLRAV